MNILFLSTENPYPPNSGHLLRTYNILRHAAITHNVFFLGFSKTLEDIKYVEPLREFCKSADVFVIPDDISRVNLVKSLFLNLFSAMPYIAQKYYRKEMMDKIKEILKENKIDIIHFDMLHLAGYRGSIKKIPTVLIEHNVESIRVKRLAKNSRNPLFKVFMYMQYLKLYHFEKNECSNYDVCAPVSENDKNILKTMCPEADLVVVPNGVDTKYFIPGNEKIIPDSIIWVGGMKDMYNHEAVDFLVDEIFPLVRTEVPNVKLTVIGRSPTKKLLQLEKTNENVKVLGYVDDVRTAIGEAAVYIAPIRSGGGTKLKILNALSMAKPVVTTTIGAEGIEVKDNEHLLIADDPELFAKKTVELLRDPVRAKKLGENGRRLMLEKYDWDIIGEKMNEIYNRVANR